MRRRASFVSLAASVLMGASALAACEEEFTGTGGLPGDVPRVDTDGGPSSDASQERADGGSQDGATSDAPKDTSASDTSSD